MGASTDEETVLELLETVPRTHPSHLAEAV
jgi:hypothetical protein